MKSVFPFESIQLSQDRIQAIEAEFGDMRNNYAARFGDEETGSFMAGIMVGARLHEADPATCTIVVSKIERESAATVPDVAESMEIHVKNIVQPFVEP